MKLSIIIPVYGVEETLGRCMESIVGQTLTDMEIILVDDGSPDRCPQMCDEWAQRDSRIRVIHRQNGGLSVARNTGLDVACGEYLTFVDSDDFIGMDTYLPLIEHLTAHPDIDIVEYPCYWHYGAKNQQVLNFKDRTYTDSMSYWLEGHAYEHTYAWNKIFRSSVFEGIRFPVGQVFEDVPTLALLLQKEPCVATTSKGLYYYCQNQQGITATAKGSELQQLLNHHIHIMESCRITDKRYYMHIVNIQIDVCELTGEKPVLPTRRTALFTRRISFSQRLKSFLILIIGINNLCKLNIFIHQQLKHR